MEAVTFNLKEFGNRELFIAKKLLYAAMGEWPEEFTGENTKIAFNRNSGLVFLTDDDYNVCVEVDGELQMFYSLPYSGEEGTIEELVKRYTEFVWEDREYIREKVVDYYNDKYTLPKFTNDLEWVEYGQTCYFVDGEEGTIKEFDWDLIDESDNKDEYIDAYFSKEVAEEELAKLQNK